MTQPGWQGHEQYVQELLGLDSTPASGAKWQAIGDAVDNHHPSDTVFPMILDCKCTEKGSFSLKVKDLQQWHIKAMELGKRFAMPIRFWPRGAYRPEDYIVVGLDDFAELLELARAHKCECCGAINTTVGPSSRGGQLCGDCSLGVHSTCECSAKADR